jgi:hypothetical protein
MNTFQHSVSVLLINIGNWLSILIATSSQAENVDGLCYPFIDKAILFGNYMIVILYVW